MLWWVYAARVTTVHTTDKIDTVRDVDNIVDSIVNNFSHEDLQHTPYPWHRFYICKTAAEARGPCW